MAPGNEKGRGPFIITVDGPSGAGKSTVCRRAAGRLGFAYIDTGAMYRTVGWAAREKGIKLDDETGLAALAAGLKIEFRTTGEENRVFCNGREVTRALRTPEIDRAASAVSAVPAVRRALLPLQRAAARAAGRGAILDGRDAGTVIFPDAALKIYLDADLATRARRRLAEQPGAGTLEQVMAALEKRDANDANRAHAPLRQAPDALRIDSSKLTVDEVVERIIALYRKKNNGR